MNARRDAAELDRSYVWHPFTPMDDWLASEPLVIESAEGFELIAADGRRYLDGVSSLWVNVHGHRVPEIDQAIRDQLDKVAHTTLLGLASPPAAELAAALVSLAPSGLEKVFYCEAGASAVEVALKIAYGYAQRRGLDRKRSFLALAEAYHGDTLGAVSVGGIDLFHAAYRPLLFDVHRAPSYADPLCLEGLERALSEHHDEICALILEPLVQAAGGMLMSPPGYLRRARELCTRYDVLLIADEVATGVGRTGTFFACEQEDVSPDILIAGKGLTGGYLPVAVTMTTRTIFDAFRGSTFFHGHTYTGNALACAAAVANLALMQKRDTVGGVREREAVAAKALEPLRSRPHVSDVRQRGLMIGIELCAANGATYPVEERVGARVCMSARDDGVVIRPLGDVVVLMPPLALPVPDLVRLVDVTSRAIDRVTR